MKRVFAIGLAAVVAVAQAWAIEPEPIETHPIPGSGTVYPPPTPEVPDPPPVTVIIGDDGNLTPVDGELPQGDNWFETALEAMTTALKTAAAISDLKTDMERQRALVNSALRGMESEIEANKCKCDPGDGDGGGDLDLYYDASADLGADGTLTVGVDVHFTGQEAAFKTATASFSKIAASGQLKDAQGTLKDIKGSLKDVSDYQACYDEAKGDWMATILEYHKDEPIPEGVITNFHPVAFSGDYNTLTNTPSIQVEEDGEGSFTLVLTTKSDEEEDSINLAKVAITGKFGDLSDIPEGDLDVVKDVSAGGDNEITISYGRIHFSSNGLEWAESGAPQNKTVTITCKCDCADDDDDSGGGGGGSSSSCTCQNCGGGGCSCQIKNGDDVNDVEKDPEWSKWKSGEFDDWKEQIDKDVTEACAAITAICEHIGYVPNVWQSRAGAGGGGQGDADDMP